MIDGDLPGPLAALAAGAITSLHCVGMCGPLSCGVCLRQGRGKTLPALLVYHGARAVSYTALGAAAGALGRLATGDLLRPLAGFFPWVFLLFFALVALGWDKRAGRAFYGVRFFAPVLARAGRLGAIPGAAVLGAVTPFLPCGPLYLMVGAAIFSGSGAQGALLLGAFAAGVIPFYLAAQVGLIRLGSILSPTGLEHTRRALALVSIALLLGRMFYPAALDNTACLMCK